MELEARQEWEMGIGFVQKASLAEATQSSRLSWSRKEPGMARESQYSLILFMKQKEFEQSTTNWPTRISEMSILVYSHNCTQSEDSSSP